MKKAIVIMIAVLLCLGLMACKDKTPKPYKITNTEALELLSENTLTTIEAFMTAVKEWSETVDISQPVDGNDFYNEDVDRLGKEIYSCLEFKALLENPEDDKIKETYLCVNPAAAISYEISKIFLESLGTTDLSTAKTTIDIEPSRWSKLLESINEADEYYLKQL